MRFFNVEDYVEYYQHTLFSHSEEYRNNIEVLRSGGFINDHDAKERNDPVLAKTNGHCFYCGILIKENLYIPEYGIEVNIYMNKDHFIPKSKGGSNYRENLVPSCQRCNHLKSNFSVEEFRNIARNEDSKRSTFWKQTILDEQGLFYFEIQGLRP